MERKNGVTYTFRASLSQGENYGGSMGKTGPQADNVITERREGGNEASPRSEGEGVNGEPAKKWSDQNSHPPSSQHKVKYSSTDLRLLSRYRGHQLLKYASKFTKEEAVLNRRVVKNEDPNEKRIPALAFAIKKCKPFQ